MDRIEQLLQDLVAIKSVTSDTKTVSKVFEYVRRQLQGLPLHYTEFDDDGFPILLIATKPGLKLQTLLVAHADVVPGNESMFKMTVANNKLHGRGVYDMKFALAGYVELFKELGDSLDKFDVGILITSDEEIRNNNIEYMLKRGLSPDNVVLPDGSSDWQLETTAKGALTLNISFQGKTAHGSKPWEGQSASMRLLDFLSDVRTKFPNENPESNTLNISKLSAGQAPNQVPDGATACLDMRFSSSRDQEDIKAWFDQQARKVGFDWNIMVDLGAIVQDITADYYFREFAASAKEVAGIKTIGKASSGASEGSHFVKLGIPCLITRPNGGGHHSDNEWVDRQSLSNFVPILKSYLRRLASISST